MSAIQRQRRRGTAAENDAFTGAEGEFVFLTDEDRIAAHNGSDQGGIRLPNMYDMANQTFVAANASGTDTITLTVANAPGAYQNLQKYVFKAAATNTGTVTLNVNSLGAQTVLKKDPATSSLIALTAGDIILNGVYTVYYNGTDFILESVDSGGLAAVSQGDLNTSQGTFSDTTVQYASLNFGHLNCVYNSNITMPGGTYGFTPETDGPYNSEMFGWWFGNDTTSYVSGATPFGINPSNRTSMTGNGRQRYVTSSPPFDMGDGEVGGFFFLNVDSNGNVISHYLADVPPWGYNGPTKIMAAAIDKATGKKYRKVVKPASFEERIDPSYKPEYILEEITHEIKNRDMGLIPHPFRGSRNEEPEYTQILLDPMCPRIKHIVEMQNAGELDETRELLKWVRPNNEGLKRKGPKKVMQCAYDLVKPK